MKRLTAIALLMTAAGSGHAQLLSAWSAPPADDGSPASILGDTWITDVNTGNFIELTLFTGSQALAADNDAGIIYSTSGRSLSSFLPDQSVGLISTGGSLRVTDEAGVGAESDQIEALGFGRGVLYASVSRSLADAQRDRGIEAGMYTIDTATARATLLLPTSVFPLLLGIDFNPVDGLMYGLIGSNNAQSVVRFDLDNFTLSTVAAIPATAYNNVIGSFDGVAVGDCRVYLTSGLGDIPIAVLNLVSGEFEASLANPTRFSENRFYPGGATFVTSLAVSSTTNPGCEPVCPADTNGDGIVSGADFSAWVAAFNAGALACDQNGDGLCSGADFSAWIDNFNAGCP